MKSLATTTNALLNGSTGSRSWTAEQELFLTTQARRLVGSFRKGEAEDGLVYDAAIKRIFATYPADVVAKVTDPVDGIAGQQNWLPTIHEVKEACERFMEPIRLRERIAETQRREQAQLEERARLDAMQAAHPTAEQIIAKQGQNYGLSCNPKREADERTERRRQDLARANRVVFERECKAAGIPTTSAISPSLVQLLRDKGAIT